MDSEKNCSVPLFLLGVPFTPLTLEEASFKIISAVKSGVQGYIATVNLDFIAHSASLFSSRARDPEFQSVLRRALFCFADGMPLVWLSKLLKCPLPERVTGQDLLPLLIDRFPEESISVAYIGGKEENIPLLRKKLIGCDPRWKEALLLSPEISIEGKEARFFREEDGAIQEQLEKRAPDFLFLGLGAPKQELWYQRNRERITARIAIGVGGSFERWLQLTPRAPPWMQKSGMEWFFRLLTDPGRLFFRYSYDFFAYFLLAVPLVLYYYTFVILPRLFLTKQAETTARLFLSEEKTLVIVQLGASLLKEDLSLFQEEIEEALDQEAIVVDGSLLRDIDLYGMGALFSLAKRAKEQSKPLFLYRFSKRMRALFVLNRLYDELKVHFEEEVDNILYALGNRTRLFLSFSATEESVAISFFGDLVDPAVLSSFEDLLLRSTFGKRVTLDFTYAGQIDRPYELIFARLKEGRNFIHK